ncbi:MAG: NAD-dependent epimerase/dehydratase family protein [Micrococcaceae bacterium]
MQTILGSGGQIANELALELKRNFTNDIRLVSRKPVKVNDTDQLMSADLMDAKATSKAVVGSDIVYLTVGLPMSSELWEQKFPTMLKNTIVACKEHDSKLVFFDNTYMYPRNSEPQTEDTPFKPIGRKATVRAQIATKLLSEMDAGNINAVICRAPEFYGPGKTQSLTNTLIFNRIRQGKKPIVPINPNTKRSIIWTPDASRAMALIGNTPDTYGQTWHLPIDENRLTYREIINHVAKVTTHKISYITTPMWAFKIGSLLNPMVKETTELLPRYKQDNIFDSSKFTGKFPEFKITSLQEGIATMLATN